MISNCQVGGRICGTTSVAPAGDSSKSELHARNALTLVLRIGADIRRNTGSCRDSAGRSALSPTALI